MQMFDRLFFRNLTIIGLLVISFTSCTKKTVPTVKTVSAWMSSDNAVSAYGSVVSDGGSFVISYGFCLSVSNPSPTIIDTKLSCVSEKGNTPSNFSASFPNLKPNTIYHIRAYAINEEGISYGETLDASISAITVKPSITEVAALAISDEAATLSAVFNLQNTTSQCWFEWGENGVLGTTTVLIPDSSVADGKVVGIRIKGLSAGHKYWFTAKAINKLGITDSPTVIFSTCVKDWDGNLYELVTIGTQTWLKSNFKGTHFANGEKILNGNDPELWATLSTGAYCNYNRSEALAQEYGRLYNFYVAVDKRPLINGWHVPTGKEFDILNNYLGSNAYAGLQVMEAGNEHWQSTLFPATNSSGFTALPNGFFAEDKLIHKYVFGGLGSSSNFCSSELFMGYEIFVEIQSYNCIFSGNGLCSPNTGIGIRLLKNDQ